MGDYSVSWNAQYASTITSVPVGSPVVVNNAGQYVLSTAAVRTSLGSRRTSGLARTAADSTNLAGDIQHNGLLLAPSVPLLGAGTQAFVRVTSSGGLERVASPSASDDVIGIVDTWGNVMLTPNMAAASFAGGVAAPPANSVQYDNAGAFGGAADVAVVAGATNYLCVGVTVGTPATEGIVRTSLGILDDALGFSIVGRTYDSKNINVISAYSQSPGRHVVAIGGYAGSFGNNRTVDYVLNYFKELYVAAFTVTTPQNTRVGFRFDSYAEAGPIGGWNYRRTFSLERHTNFVLFGSRSSLTTANDALANGEGVLHLGPAEVIPDGSAGVSGATFFTDANDRVAYMRLAGKQRVPVWDGPEKIVSTTGSLNDLSTLDSAGLPISVLRLTGANPTLTGLSDGREGRSVDVVYDGDTGLIVSSNDALSVAANRLSGGVRVTQWVTSGGRVRFTYCMNLARWAQASMSQPVAPSGSTDDIVSISSQGLLQSAGTIANLTAKELNTFTFSSDANATMATYQSLSMAIIVAAGTLTATRNLTSTLSASTTRQQFIRNLNAQNVAFGWATGTRVTVNGGGTNWALIGCDGTNAVTIASGT